MYTIVCPNPFHKRATVTVEGDTCMVSFERDGDVAKATGVPEAVAGALLEADDAYEVAGPEEDPEWPEMSEDPEPPSVIDGIGPKTEEALAEADIITVEALADADAETLAGETGLGEDELSGWIKAARARLG